MLDLHIKVNFRVGKRSIITMEITPEKNGNKPRLQPLKQLEVVFIVWMFKH